MSSELIIGGPIQESIGGPIIGKAIKNAMGEQTTFGQRVREARLEARLTQAALAKAAGMKQPTIAEIEAGDYKESKRINALARALKVNPDWLETGKAPKHLLHVSPVVLVEGSDDEFVEVRALTLKTAAGGGYVVDYVAVKGGRAYTRDYFRKRGLKPELCFRATVIGDSMEPHLFDGDEVLVNGGEKEILSGRVYAFAVRQEPRVKRFFWQADGTLKIHSDNEARYPDEILTKEAAESFEVLGRVVDKSGSGGL